MGHAGALISGGADTADAKLAIMEECGFKVTRNPSEMGRLLKQRSPVIITLGAALLGFVAGEMLVSDRSVAHHFEGSGHALGMAVAVVGAVAAVGDWPVVGEPKAASRGIGLAVLLAHRKPTICAAMSPACPGRSRSLGPIS
jgi:hypothetical protein